MKTKTGTRSRVVALIVTADPPPQGAPRFGPESQGTIRALLDSPATGRRELRAATFRYADDHWLAPGMEVPVFINHSLANHSLTNHSLTNHGVTDPAYPETFEVDWAAVPRMRQQAQANHPALADPFATAERIALAMGSVPSEKTASQYRRFEAEVAACGARPVLTGRRRAVAVIATVRGRHWSSDSEGGGHTGGGVFLTGSSAAVLSVVIPGRPAYAVYVPKFKVPRQRLSVPGEPMPALVTDADPGNVEILWDEMPSLDEQIAARMADSRATHAQRSRLNESFPAGGDEGSASMLPGVNMPFGEARKR